MLYARLQPACWTQLAAREEERDRSVARLRALIAALPDPVFVLEDSGRIAEVLAGSGHAARSARRPSCAAATSTQIIGVELGTALAEALSTALASGQPQRLAYELDFSAGRRWFDAVLVPLARGAGGRETPNGWCCSSPAT